MSNLNKEVSIKNSWQVNIVNAILRTEIGFTVRSQENYR